MTRDATGIFQQLKNRVIFEWQLLRLKTKIRIEFYKQKYQQLKNRVKARFFV